MVTELNPGPNTSPISVLTMRIAETRLRPVNIVGDGNCFFRSVIHLSMLSPRVGGSGKGSGTD